LSRRDPTSIRFKLSELDIKGKSWNPENFSKFFANQGDLQVLKLQRNFPIEAQEMHGIVKHLMRSEKLRIFEHMCYFRLAFTPDYVLKTVEEFKMFINIPGPYISREISQLVKLIPNVKKLSISIWTMVPEYFGLGDISGLNSLEKLAELEVSLFIDVLCQLHLPNLLKFTFSNLENRYGYIFLDDRVLPFLEKHQMLREIHFVDGFISKCIWNYIEHYMDDVVLVSVKCARQYEMEILLEHVKRNRKFSVEYKELEHTMTMQRKI
jgi:hypothetical protein